jgi:hypothetical protein
MFYSFQTRLLAPVMQLEKRPIPWTENLAASRDGRTVFIAQNVFASSITMVENFQLAPSTHPGRVVRADESSSSRFSKDPSRNGFADVLLAVALEVNPGQTRPNRPAPLITHMIRRKTWPRMSSSHQPPAPTLKSTSPSQKDAKTPLVLTVNAAPNSPFSTPPAARNPQPQRRA